MHKFNVKDLVVVRSVEDMLLDGMTKRGEYLISPSGVWLNEEMLKCIGEQYEITQIVPRSDGTCSYRLKGSSWYWTDEMLDPPETQAVVQLMSYESLMSGISE